MSTSTLIFYIFLGSSSLAYLMYAKAQRNAMALISGIGLGILPYANLSMWLMLVIAVGILALPFVVRA